MAELVELQGHLHRHILAAESNILELGPGCTPGDFAELDDLRQRRFRVDKRIEELKQTEDDGLINVLQIQQRMRESYPGDREKAARMLGRLGQRAGSAVPTLRKALKDSSGPVRNAAAWALAEIGTAEARQALREYEDH